MLAQENELLTLTHATVQLKNFFFYCTFILEIQYLVAEVKKIKIKANIVQYDRKQQQKQIPTVKCFVSFILMHKVILNIIHDCKVVYII